jgi:hypothetical protein
MEAEIVEVAMVIEIVAEVLEIGMEIEVLVIEMEIEVLEIEIVVLKERCIRLHALNAVMNVLFLLNQFKINLFIAGIVL